VPPPGDTAVSLRPLNVAPLSYVEYSATVKDATNGTSAGLVFSATAPNTYLYAGIIAGTNQVVLGHRDAGTWYVDAVASTTISVGTNYTLLVALSEGLTNNVNVVLNGKSVLNFNYNFLVHDGSVGLYARDGSASFDNVLLRGDDIAYSGGGAPLAAATAPAHEGTNTATLDAGTLTAMLAEAEQRWIDSGLVNAQAITALGAIEVRVADLDGLTLGLTNENEHAIIIDSNAAGYGWFVDSTPGNDREFAQSLSADERVATPGSAAYGRIDLLTVIEHEFGHLLGYEHGTLDVMGATLVAGERITPALAAASIDAVGAVSGATVVADLTFGAGMSSTLNVVDGLKPAPSDAPLPPFAGLAPVSQIVIPGATASPTVFSSIRFDIPQASGDALTAELLADKSGSSWTPAADDQTDASDARSHSSHKLDEPSAPVINWDDNLGDPQVSSGSSNGKDWLDDFLNHLGQDESQRNPNAALRVRPGSNVQLET
jgi:hypothetical protein